MDGKLYMLEQLQVGEISLRINTAAGSVRKPAAEREASGIEEQAILVHVSKS